MTDFAMGLQWSQAMTYLLVGLWAIAGGIALVEVERRGWIVFQRRAEEF